MALVRLPEQTELAELVGQVFSEAKQNPTTTGAGWSVRFTPPLPTPWPAPEAVVVFAYATTLPIANRNGRPVLAAVDAMLVAHPFAAVWLRADRSPHVDTLATSIQSAGMQGFGPASPVERNLATRRGEVFAEVLSLSPPLSALANAYYRHWLSVAGVVARCLPETQRPFLRDIDDRYA
jgi:hypothetical protein